MNRWFHFRFRMVWPDGASPRWWIDILILDTIIRGILQLHRSQMVLWRVHRRAAPDSSGHQLTLLVYTQELIAQAIDQRIQSGHALEAFRQHKLVRDYFLERETGDGIFLVEGTSDRSWPVEIQQSWPYFIMGVTEMLMDIIARLRGSAEQPDLSADLATVQRFYEELNQRLTSLWRQHASHAFLHHLNALFGYVPLVATPNIQGLLVSF